MFNKTALFALALASLAVAASSGVAFAQSKPTIGIAMPTKSSARWIDDGNNIVKVLKERGYGTDLQYAEDDIPNQLSQVENMVTKGAKVLVIAAIDGTTLSDVLKQAKAKGITVIAYDRLIRDTPNVDYYATFDNFQVGVLQAQSIEQGLGLKEGKGPFNIELFGGSPDDNNAYFFYNGAMSVLKPYIDSGKLVVVSGQMGMDKVATLRWDGATAQARMDNLLSAYYGKKRVDAVLSPYDGLSIGIISSLKGVGYGSPDLPMPIISGQDAEVPSIKAMLRGEQYSTIFKDTRDLARVTVDMVDAVLSGKEVPVNDTKTYNNGVKTVPSYLLKPVVVYKSNWEKAWSRAAIISARSSSERTRPACMVLRALPTRQDELGAAGGNPMTAMLEMRGVSKSFAGVQALRDVNFTVEAGQIHALVGENGAGKSTLMKVLSGVYPHGSYEGTIIFDGKERRFRDINDSEALGIIIIHQELALIPLMSIAENIFLSHPPARFGVIDRDTAYRRTREVLAQVGLREYPDALVTDLGVGKQQLVEIAKALSKRVRLLILDEPTASLNEIDSAALLNRLVAFREQGIASILISHKLNEVARAADRITVLRDGRTVDDIDCRTEPVEEDRIIRSMVDRDLAHRFPERRRQDRGSGFGGGGLVGAPSTSSRAADNQKCRLSRAAWRSRGRCRPDGRGPYRVRDESLRSGVGP